MVATDIQLDYDQDPFFKAEPFHIQIVDELFDRWDFHLTEAQMAYLYERAQAPLMRARAQRSTPGLVEP